MLLAERLKRLGTETAFAVSAEAATFKAQGNHVYPFHLGDMNINTPVNIIEAANKAMHDGFTGYCPNFGIPLLREALANDINLSHGTEYSAQNVAIQPGGKPVIGKFIMALMNPGEEVLYPNPGYPIYESQIEYHGGVAVPYEYTEGAENFCIDIEQIEAKITPKTKAIIINDLQNPMGAEMSPEERRRISEIAVKHDLVVLLDEAYFDMRYESKSVSLVEEPGMLERSVILYTFSKKFAMTGWRLGAAIGPEKIISAIAKLNVNDESCSNHFIQYAAIEALTGTQSGPDHIVSTLKGRRDKCVDILNSIEGVNCYRPHATFYLFPNVTNVMQRLGMLDYDQFRRAALENTGVSFCTRLHFGRPQPNEENLYIRLAYSGIDNEQIEEGLSKFKGWIDSF